MKHLKCFAIQNGEVIPEEVIELFPKSLKNSNIGQNKEGKICRFVGFIINGNDILVSFPKYFLNKEDILDLNLAENRNELVENMKLLFNVLFKARNDKKCKKYVDGVGISEKIEEGYPFEAFYNIYKYYRCFGLYNVKVKILF